MRETQIEPFGSRDRSGETSLGQPPKLRIFLLGEPQVVYRGREVDAFARCRGKKLFFYLLLHRGRTIGREILADRLSPGRRSTSNSMRSLRNALWELKRLLTAVGCAGILSVSRHSVTLELGTQCWLDVQAFEQGVQRALNVLESLSGNERSQAMLTAEIYNGRLLPGCPDEWCEFERNRLNELYLLLLMRLAKSFEKSAAYGTALSYCQRVIRNDRAFEGAHRQLMRLYLLMGDRTGAIRQFHECRAALHEELGTQPGAMTTTLFERIREGETWPEPAPV